MERDARILRHLVVFIIPFKTYYRKFNIIISSISQFNYNKESRSSHSGPRHSPWSKRDSKGVLVESWCEVLALKHKRPP